MTEKNPVYYTTTPNIQDISAIFKLPFPLIIVDKKGNIHGLNEAAQKSLRIPNELLQQKLHLQMITVDSKHCLEIINETYAQNKLNCSQMLLRRFDNSIAYADVNIAIWPENKSLIAVEFSEATSKSQIFFTELIQTFRREVMRLRPYLNKAGKELMQEIIANNVLESTGQKNPSIVASNEIVQENITSRLSQAFPVLTKSELSLCCFLSMKMSVEEIAALTGKSANCLRVSLHRIVHKTGFDNSRQLIMKLKAINTSL